MIEWLQICNNLVFGQYHSHNAFVSSQAQRIYEQSSMHKSGFLKGETWLKMKCVNFIQPERGANREII